MNGNQAKWAEKAARIGYVTKGIVYFLVGGLSAMAAFGLGGDVSGKKDVFQWIIGLPFGRILLGAVAAGLLGYVSWRFIQAIKDPENRGNDFKAIMKRIGIAASGLAYTAVAFYAGKLALMPSGDDGGDSRQFFVSKLLQQPAGQWIVGAIAVFFAGMGVYYIFKAVSGKYKKRIDSDQMSEDERKAVMTAGRIGYIARGTVIGIIGFLFLKAALNSNASQADGTEGAFKFLQDSGYGPWLMGAVALGLVSYGIFCFVMAKYRPINIQ